MSKKKITGIVLLTALAIIQFIPSEKPKVDDSNPSDLFATTNVSGSVRQSIQNACYDCHSNESVYPWYSNIAPIKWLVYHDIRVGREELNFSEWNELSKLKKVKFLGKITEEIPDAKLSVTQKQELAEWTKNYAESLFLKQ
jgi:hypothetical protein